MPEKKRIHVILFYWCHQRTILKFNDLVKDIYTQITAITIKFDLLIF